MAKIVNREEKKREIALAARDVFAEYGLHKITVDKIAAAAGIGKGTVYHYFANKEEIVLEIWESLYEGHHEWLDSNLAQCKSSAEKIFAYLFLGHFDEMQMEKNYRLYRDFISAALSQVSLQFQAYSRKKFEEEMLWVKTRLDEGIAQGEFKPVDTTVFAQVVIEAKNGCIYGAMERGMNVSYINTIMPIIISTTLQTISTKG